MLFVLYSLSIAMLVFLELMIFATGVYAIHNARIFVFEWHVFFFLPKTFQFSSNTLVGWFAGHVSAICISTLNLPVLFIDHIGLPALSLSSASSPSFKSVPFFSRSFRSLILYFNSDKKYLTHSIRVLVHTNKTRSAWARFCEKINCKDFGKINASTSFNNYINFIAYLNCESKRVQWSSIFLVLHSHLITSEQKCAHT